MCPSRYRRHPSQFGGHSIQGQVTSIVQVTGGEGPLITETHSVEDVNVCCFISEGTNIGYWIQEEEEKRKGKRTKWGKMSYASTRQLSLRRSWCNRRVSFLSRTLIQGPRFKDTVAYVSIHLRRSWCLKRGTEADFVRGPRFKDRSP